MKIFAIGVKRFCHNVSDLDVPSSFDNLGLFLLRHAQAFYGSVVESAIAMLLDGAMHFDDWTAALQYDSSGSLVAMDEFHLLRIATSLDEWICDFDGQFVTLSSQSGFEIPCLSRPITIHH